MEHDQEYHFIPVEAAADILKMSARMVNNYGHSGRIQTKKAGRRVLYLRTDVEALASELAVDVRPPPKAPRSDLVPVGEMLEYIRDRDIRNDQLQNQLHAAAAEIATLRERLDHQKLLVDEQATLRTRIAELEQQLAEREQQATIPWWKKLFGTS